MAYMLRRYGIVGMKASRYRCLGCLGSVWMSCRRMRTDRRTVERACVSVRCVMGLMVERRANVVDVVAKCHDVCLAWYVSMLSIIS